MNIDYWRKKAEDGSNAGLLHMGICYLQGTGVEQDFAEAFRLLSLAHEKGALTGTFLLGTIYEDGLGVAQDMARAIDLYEQAARIDHVSALLNLARIHRHGKGVMADRRRAAQYYRRILRQAGEMEVRSRDAWAEEINEARDFVEDAA